MGAVEQHAISIVRLLHEACSNISHLLQMMPKKKKKKKAQPAT